MNLIGTKHQSPSETTSQQPARKKGRPRLNPHILVRDIRPRPRRKSEIARKAAGGRRGLERMREREGRERGGKGKEGDGDEVEGRKGEDEGEREEDGDGDGVEEGEGEEIEGNNSMVEDGILLIGNDVPHQQPILPLQSTSTSTSHLLLPSPIILPPIPKVTRKRKTQVQKEGNQVEIDHRSRMGGNVSSSGFVESLPKRHRIGISMDREGETVDGQLVLDDHGGLDSTVGLKVGVNGMMGLALESLEAAAAGEVVGSVVGNTTMDSEARNGINSSSSTVEGTGNQVHIDLQQPNGGQGQDLTLSTALHLSNAAGHHRLDVPSEEHESLGLSDELGIMQPYAGLEMDEREWEELLMSAGATVEGNE